MALPLSDHQEWRRQGAAEAAGKAWMVREANEEAQAERFRKAQEEAAKKHEARDGFVKAHTCPHCGQCPPLPPWLY